jgi:hypothetical protein
MRLTYSTIIFFLACLLVAYAECEAEKSLLRIEQATPEILQLLIDMNIEVDNVRGLGSASGWETVNGPEIDVWMNSNEQVQISNLSIEYFEIETAYEQYIREFDPSRDPTLYHDYPEVTSELQAIEAAHPNICQLYSAGLSEQGRELWVLKITDNPTIDENEPEFKYVSTMHGDEPVGTELLLYMIDEIVSSYGSNTQIDNLVNNVEIHILPLMNPDGNIAGIRNNINGINLNRSFPDPYTDDNNTTVGRPAETAAVMNWTFAKDFDLSANFHTGATVVNFPFDNNPSGSSVYTISPDDDIYIDMSEAYSITNLPMWNGSFTHGITNGADWYAISGGMQDWNYRYEGGMEVTIELNDTKWPNDSQLAGLWSDNRDSMFAYMEYCLRGIRGIVTDSNTGLALSGAEVRIVGRDISTYSAAVIGDYHRLCPAGSYTLEVSKSGYYSQTINGIIVGNGNASVHDVALVPMSPEPDLQIVLIEVIDGDNGSLDPGESVQIAITIENQGTDIATSTLAELSCSSPLITLNTSVDSAGSLNPGSSAIVSYDLSVSGAAPIGAVANFSLDLSATGYNANRSFTESIGLIMEDFESAGFNSFAWEMNGNADWQLRSDAYEGSWSAESGTVSHDQTSELSITLDVISAGTISFYQMVSSEATYDFLHFYIDAIEQDAWSGNSGWQYEEFAVDAGTHTFRWVYEKDGSVSSGDDLGAIDNIIFPPTGAPQYPNIALDPNALDITLAPGTTGSLPVSLGNTGDGELIWNSSINITDRRVSQTPVLKLRKGELDPRPGSIMRDQGGPDFYGYIWTDSDETGGPVFNWFDISSVGTSPGDADDENYGAFPLGFDFSFYGNSFSTVRLCTNGFLSFTSTATTYANTQIGDSDEPNNLIAPFFDDLSPNQTGDLYYYADNDNNRFIVQWSDVSHYISGGGSNNPETFQVIINADGSIIFQYYTISDASSCTVGLESSNGTGLDVLYNADGYLHSNMAIRLATEPETTPWLALSPPSGTLAAGNNQMLSAQFDTGEMAAGLYHADLVINSNDPDENSITIPVTMTIGQLSIEPVYDLQIQCNSGTLTLNWSPVDGANSYLIYISVEAYTGYNLLGSVSTNTYEGSCSTGEVFFRIVASTD